MQPTDGLGRLSGRPRAASRAAAASHSASERGGLLLPVCNAAARRLFARFIALDLALHRIDVEPGRAAGTAIYFVLERGQRSHWHRVDADELWLWHAGAPIDLMVEQPDGAIRGFVLGGDVARGYAPQCLVPANRWQSAEAGSGWALMSCIVVPGFDFSGFELAPPGWSPQ